MLLEILKTTYLKGTPIHPSTYLIKYNSIFCMRSSKNREKLIPNLESLETWSTKDNKTCLLLIQLVSVYEKHNFLLPNVLNNLLIFQVLADKGQ